MPKANEIKIYYADIKSRTPARCNRRTGEIYLNINRWHDIEPAHKVFIILHEMAHIILNSSDELKVDAWAQAQYVAHGYPLTESVRAITSVLHGDSEEQIERGLQALSNAKLIQKQMNNSNSIHEIIQNNIDGEESFLGLGKKARARKQERHEVKIEKKRAKNGIKLARASAITTRAEGKVSNDQILAEQGISAGNGGMNLLDKVGGIAKGIFGKGGGESEENGGTGSNNSAAKKWYQTTGAIVGIVVGGLVVIVGVIFAVKHFNKAK